MTAFFLNKISKGRQYLFSLFVIAIAFGICFLLSVFIHYMVIGLILLLVISLLAISFDILPVLLSAFLTAIIWNYFFIPPRFTFHIAKTEDVVLLSMYFIIAMVNAVLTYKIRQFERIAREKEDRANTLRLYNTLLNSLSHELRTPIATIIGATDTLQMQKNLSQFDTGELLYEISKASIRLNHQVENLLNMSRLESGFLKPKNDWCDVGEVVYDVMKMIDENRYTQKINININPDLPLFRLDKGMLQQVLYNLLNNACVYTQPDANIQLMALCHGNMLKIVVEDNGPGFPKDEIHKVFQKFYRLKNSKSGGTGLGLSIVKGFTEAMNGTVQLTNLLPAGCQITINIKTDVSNVNKKREPWLIRKF
jgi:two-component system, OmpR family, sensor histidine kinase KdpD